MFLIRLLKRLAILLVSLLVILAIVGLFLPDSASVERKMVINGEPEKIYPWISSLRRFNEWSPWANLDPNIAVEFSGPEAGEGAKMAWSSEMPSVGTGSQTITEVKENEYVRAALDFGDQGDATAAWLLAPVDGGQTEITWQFHTQFGYDIIGRYFGLLLDRWVGQAYEQGLATLKTRVEAN
jgi:hypothetical protein